MSNDITLGSSAPRTLVTFEDMSRMADCFAKSGMFGMKTYEQALSLMLIAQAEGRHPAIAARDYDIIQNRPSKKAEAMLRDFMEAGGKVEWHALDDTIADATFSHPAGGKVRICWDMARATAAGLGTKDMWKKYRRQMLRSRTVSEGVRTVCPAATSGMYVPEEVSDFASPSRSVDTNTIDAEPEAKEPTAPPVAIAPPADPATLVLQERDGGGHNWVGWGSQLIAALKASQDRAVLERWISSNLDTLATCEDKAPKAFKSVSAVMMAMREKLQELPTIVAPNDLPEEPNWAEPSDTANALKAA